ncbi:hypothetical protein XBFM1_1940005 [Xenorhabdus bovienii str. feltiae Moldova]|uniref:Uncharacterized protein n=2 Tax=Xenorhabdus bovienii TaxID=40576 RepID=A0A0B6X605_XENBV|nr:hypothetical protein XBFM1_1940005 [Xenorhabdus bovienii str. feltiae Moldova]CDM89292.1 conserved protein of unknown function [Xenorhabdus bovienii]
MTHQITVKQLKATLPHCVLSSLPANHNIEQILMSELSNMAIHSLSSKISLSL